MKEADFATARNLNTVVWIVLPTAQATLNRKCVIQIHVPSMADGDNLAIGVPVP